MSFHSVGSAYSGESSDDDDERHPMLTANEDQINRLRDTYLNDSIHKLNLVAITIVYLVVAVLISSIVVVLTSHSLFWIPFVVLLIGNPIIFVFLLDCIDLISKSFGVDSTSASKGLVENRVGNENRIPLAVFILKLVLEIFVTLSLLCISELLLILGLYDIFSLQWALVPLFFILVPVVITPIFLRLQSLLITVSAALLVSFLIMLQLKIRNFLESWIITSIPFFILLVGWLALLLYIAFGSCCAGFRLQKHQQVALTLYLLGGAIFTSSTALLVCDLQYSQLTENHKNQAILLGAFTIATLFISFAALIDVHEQLAEKTKQFGNQRPQPLGKDHQGRWILDQPRIIRNFVLLGDLQPPEYIRLGESISGDSNYMGKLLAGCCSCGIEMFKLRSQLQRQQQQQQGGVSSGASNNSGRGTPTHFGSNKRRNPMRVPSDSSSDEDDYSNPYQVKPSRNNSRDSNGSGRRNYGSMV